MNKRFSAGLLVVALSACASSGRIGDLPAVAEGATSSQLVLIRVSSFVGATNSYYVALDGRDIFSLRSGQYTEFRIPTGEHFVAVKCFGGWSPSWKKESKRFVAAQDQTNYFEMSPNLSCADIDPVTAEEAKKMMTGSTFISPETVSNKQPRP